MPAMLVLLLALSLGQTTRSPSAGRDVAIIDPTGATTTGASALARLPVAEVERRLAALIQKNKRAYSDQRALLIQGLKAELERRRQESEWESEQVRRDAEQAAATARLEEQYQADQQRQRAADEAARQAIAAARAAAEAEAREQARLEAEERAAARHRAIIQWSAAGILGLAAAVIGTAAYRKRR